MKRTIILLLMMTIVGVVMSQDLPAIVSTYPNPFDGQCSSVLRLAESEEVTVEVVNLTGAVLSHQTGYLAAGEHRIELSLIEPQVAVLRVHTSKGTVTTKLYNSSRGIDNTIEISTMSQVAKETGKEQVAEGDGGADENQSKQMSRILYYSIDGVNRTASYDSDIELEQLIQKMTTVARGGHVVSFSNKSNRPRPRMGLETITFTTKLESEAIAWCKKMCDNGYTVEMRYVLDTKTYHCTATRQQRPLDHSATLSVDR